MGEGWRGDFFLVVLMSLEKKPNPGEAVNFWLHPTRKHGNTQREQGIKTERLTERKREGERGREGKREEGNVGSM